MKINEALAQKAHDALNLVTKWRTVFVGWQLGTRVKGDPEADAVRDHRELTIILRVEQTALLKALVDKGVLTLDDYHAAVANEALLLNADYEQRFPGVTATADGLSMNPQKIMEQGTFKGWKP